MSDMKILLFMSFCLLCGGTLSGWAITDTLAGNTGGMNFLCFGLVSFAIFFAVQVTLLFKARNRLFYQIIFSSFLLVSLAWLMMCLVLPIYWVTTISIPVKGGIFAFTVLLFFCNGCEGVRQFKRRWSEKNPVSQSYYNPKKSSLDWDEIAKSLHISVSMYIPGVPRKIMPVLSVLIIISMIIGLNFRKLYPTASVFAWGFPCIIVTSILVQMLSIGIAQAFKVIAIEEQIGAKIRCKIN